MSKSENTAFAEIQRAIRVHTVEMDTPTYCWLLRKVAEWCEDQANIQEYVEDYTDDFTGYDDNE